MTLKEIEIRMEQLVQSEMDYLRQKGFQGNLRAAAENRVGDIFWKIGLRWNRKRAKEW